MFDLVASVYTICRSGVLLRTILVLAERLKVPDFQRTLRGTLKGMSGALYMML